MPPSIVTRRAAQIRDLLARGVLSGARIPLRNGGTFPAELFARVALARGYANTRPDDVHV